MCLITHPRYTAIIGSLTTVFSSARMIIIKPYHAHMYMCALIWKSKKPAIAIWNNMDLNFRVS